MKHIQYLIYLSVFLVQCKSETLNDLRAETPVMMAVIRSGETAGGVQLFHLDETSGVTHPISDAILSIANQNSLDKSDFFFADGAYQSNLMIESGQNYTISGQADGKHFQVDLPIPPTLTFTIPINNTLEINENSSGSTAAIVTWTELDNERYSYVVRMECLEENPMEIPFPVNSGNFASNFSGPLVEPGIIIADTDFKYYGSNRLTVFAIPKELEKVYFYNAGDIRGLLTNSPDNILGIKGFAVGVSVLETTFFLQPG